MALITVNLNITTSSVPEGSNLYFTNNRVLITTLAGLNVTGGTITSSDTVLSAFGKAQNQINSLVGGVNYQGVWNATTNSPAIVSSVGTKGYYYVVNVAGSTNINGITDWKVGDWIIFNGATWEKVDNTDAVSSVNGQVGAVSLTTTNIAEGTNLYYTDARAQAAITGTSNRITVTAGVVDISVNYVGQTSIITVGTILTGTWQGTSISTSYTDAKIKTVTGTSSRITIGGTAVDPTFDISTSYAGQATIVTLGTVTTGTWSATAIAVNKGGTGFSSYTVGDILYADTTSSLAKLSDAATGNALISGGVGVAPSWGKVALTTHISGILPIANGGTNASSASITAFNNITGYSASGASGTTSTNLVFSTSPTITTPTFVTRITTPNVTTTADNAQEPFTVVRGTASSNFITAIKTGFVDATTFGAYNDANGGYAYVGCNTALTDGGTVIQYNSSHQGWIMTMDGRSSGSFDIYRKASGGVVLTSFLHIASDGKSSFGGTASSSPSSWVHISAGTTSVGPLKLTSGANLTTAEAGAMEWDGTNLFITQTAGPTRKTIAYTTDTTRYLFDYFTDAGNGTTVETDLYSSTTVASQLSANGQKLSSEYGGTFVSSATATRQIKIYFGGTAIFDTGALTLSLSSAWTVFVDIIRVSSTVIRYMVSLTTQGAAVSAYTSAGELTGLTLSNTNILKITGTAAGVGAASNDIVAKMGFVKWAPAS